MNLSDTPCTWLVQSTVRGDTRDRIERACAALEKPFQLIPVIPFSTEMPEDMPEVEGPFLFYGYTTLLLNAFRDPRWRRGVFFDPAVFRPSVYCEKWGQRMLNYDAQILTMRAFAESESALDRHWFIKPDDDLKRFTGGVMTFGEYREWYAGIATLEGEGDIGPETQILVCEPKEIGPEWRFFIINGRIAAESCYTNDGRDLAPLPEVTQFAHNAANVWSPDNAFALDVALKDDGSPCIIEANCINGSGLYFADTLALVRSLSKWQEINW